MNAELLALYEADQADRLDWSITAAWDEERRDALTRTGARDEERRQAAMRIVESGGATVAADWFHAAMVMQHGRALSDFERAHTWAKRAADLDPTLGEAKWLAAAAKDRWLVIGSVERRGGAASPLVLW